MPRRIHGSDDPADWRIWRSTTSSASVSRPASKYVVAMYSRSSESKNPAPPPVR